MVDLTAGTPVRSTGVFDAVLADDGDLRVRVRRGFVSQARCGFDVEFEFEALSAEDEKLFNGVTFWDDGAIDSIFEVDASWTQAVLAGSTRKDRGSLVVFTLAWIMPPPIHDGQCSVRYTIPRLSLSKELCFDPAVLPPLPAAHTAAHRLLRDSSEEPVLWVI